MPQLFFPHNPWAIGAEAGILVWVAQRFPELGRALDPLGLGPEIMTAVILGGAYGAYNAFVVPR